MSWDLGNLYALRLRFWRFQYQDHLQLLEEREKVQVSWQHAFNQISEINQLKFGEKQGEKWKASWNAGKYGGK